MHSGYVNYRLLMSIVTLARCYLLGVTRCYLMSRWEVSTSVGVGKPYYLQLMMLGLPDAVQVNVMVAPSITMWSG